MDREAREALYEAHRAAMTEEHILGRGVRDAAVLDAFRAVRRHRFVPARAARFAYEDNALPIGHDQTISQPYIVAVMLEAARIEPGARVLDVGTGSGYVAALLAEMGAEVHTVERIEPLAERAAAALQEEGYGAVHCHIGDGYEGWPEGAPYDAIVVGAAPPAVPPTLVDQLRPGGRLVIPVGTTAQDLKVIQKTAGRTHTTELCPVLFVPMIPAVDAG